MAKKIKCGCGAVADVKYTKQRPGALRRMPPKPYTDCPNCGPVYGSSRGRVEWINREAYEEAPPVSDTAPEKTAVTEVAPLSDNSPAVSDIPPPKKGGLFSGWVPL